MTNYVGQDIIIPKILNRFVIILIRSHFKYI